MLTAAVQQAESLFISLSNIRNIIFDFYTINMFSSTVGVEVAVYVLPNYLYQFFDE